MRKKPKYLLLRGKDGWFIIVERKMYDLSGTAKHRGDSKSYWIVRESNDLDMLKAVGRLTEKLIFDTVNT